MKTSHESSANDRLTSKDFWDAQWSDVAGPIDFDPTRPGFSDVHEMLLRVLPKDPTLRCLEIGCFPGTYMWYFKTFFGYRIAGIEYVDRCISACKENFRKLGMEAEIIHDDVFTYTPPEGRELWDVVASFGFIEHFEDSEKVIARHLDLLKPGGFLVLVIPNHAGLNGEILKRVDHQNYLAHNQMSYERMERALAATGRAELVEGGYRGRIGFWATQLYAKAAERGRVAYLLVRAPLHVLETVGKYVMPNTKFFAPSSALIARKK